MAGYIGTIACTAMSMATLSKVDYITQLFRTFKMSLFFQEDVLIIFGDMSPYIGCTVASGVVGVCTALR